LGTGETLDLGVAGGDRLEAIDLGSAQFLGQPVALPGRRRGGAHLAVRATFTDPAINFIRT
jgi:hypothetical protein